MKPHILAGVSPDVAEYTVTGWLVKFERSAVVGLVTPREHLPLRLCPSSIGESLRSLFTGFLLAILRFYGTNLCFHIQIWLSYIDIPYSTGFVPSKVPTSGLSMGFPYYTPIVSIIVST